MSKFKVGDEVKAKDINQFTVKDIELIVSYVSGDRFRSDDSPFPKYLYNMNSFDLVRAGESTIEQAKRTLEEAGYTITPPPESLKGKAYVFRSKFAASVGQDNEFFIRPYNLGHWDDSHDVIAIVDWEEGQGL